MASCGLLGAPGLLQPALGVGKYPVFSVSGACLRTLVRRSKANEKRPLPVAGRYRTPWPLLCKLRCVQGQERSPGHAHPAGLEEISLGFHGCGETIGGGGGGEGSESCPAMCRSPLDAQHCTGARGKHAALLCRVDRPEPQWQGQPVQLGPEDHVCLGCLGVRLDPLVPSAGRGGARVHPRPRHEHTRPGGEAMEEAPRPGAAT